MKKRVYPASGMDLMDAPIAGKRTLAITYGSETVRLGGQ